MPISTMGIRRASYTPKLTLQPPYWGRWRMCAWDPLRSGDAVRTWCPRLESAVTGLPQTNTKPSWMLPVLGSMSWEGDRHRRAASSEGVIIYASVRRRPRQPSRPGTLMFSMTIASAVVPGSRASLMPHMRSAGASGALPLSQPTRREALVVTGLMNTQISGQLGISEIAVKDHRGRVTRNMKSRFPSDLV